MMFRLLILGALGLSAFLGGCTNAAGRSLSGEMPATPSEVSDFGALYGQNCAGCHGVDGKGGAAIALANPVYLAVADAEVLRRVTASGIPATSMPAFAQSAGGMLTDKQVDVIVNGIRDRWSKPDVLLGADPPPYSSSAPGDSTRGSQVYETYCSSCHGAGGHGGQKASSIVDGSFLALVNDQELRTIVITGRPELGAPDWRSDLAGKPMSPQDISDVVAWLASQRPKFPDLPFPKAGNLIGEIR
ncbi:MAG TPA: c-type cytochrome [Candidatus Acidoferrales bacterium]|jgi:mono/diheme cytochrome c family protein|nr:c-type cytochrome [Candidatus Acidoferrales bacterium]